MKGVSKVPDLALACEQWLTDHATDVCTDGYVQLMHQELQRPGILPCWGIDEGLAQSGPRTPTSTSASQAKHGQLNICEHSRLPVVLGLCLSGCGQ